MNLMRVRFNLEHLPQLWDLVGDWEMVLRMTYHDYVNKDVFNDHVNVVIITHYFIQVLVRQVVKMDLSFGDVVFLLNFISD